MPAVFDANTRLTLRQRLAFTYMRLGDWAAAEPMINMLLQQRMALNGPRHPATLQLELNQAQVQIAQRHAAAALPELNRIYPDFVAVFGPDHLLTLELLSTRGQAYDQLEQYQNAVADQMAIYQLATAKRGDHSFLALGTLTDAADSNCRAGNTQAGLQAARAGYDGATVAFGPHTTLTQMGAVTLAFCLITAGQYTAALPLLQGIDTKAIAEFAMDPVFAAKLDLMRAAIAQASGDTAQANALLASAAPAIEKDSDDTYMRKWARRLKAPIEAAKK
jgi:hypothetical protein